MPGEIEQLWQDGVPHAPSGFADWGENASQAIDENTAKVADAAAGETLLRSTTTSDSLTSGTTEVDSGTIGLPAGWSSALLLVEGFIVIRLDYQSSPDYSRGSASVDVDGDGQMPGSWWGLVRTDEVGGLTWRTAVPLVGEPKEISGDVPWSLSVHVESGAVVRADNRLLRAVMHRLP